MQHGWSSAGGGEGIADARNTVFPGAQDGTLALEVGDSHAGGTHAHWTADVLWFASFAHEALYCLHCSRVQIAFLAAGNQERARVRA